MMKNNLAAKFLPIVSDEKKIEVSLTEDQAIIKLSTWIEDLGWCSQKTLTVDADMLDDLHRVIASARYKLKGRKSGRKEINLPPKVLEFPSFS